jgi:hypothetical protein
VIGFPLMVSQDIDGMKMHYQDRKVPPSCQGWIEKGIRQIRVGYAMTKRFPQRNRPNFQKRKISKNITKYDIYGD